MSTTITCYAVIGVELDITWQDFDTIRSKSCTCQFDHANTNFCPKCGAKVTEHPSRYPNYQDLEDLETALCDEICDGSEAVNNWMMAYTNDYDEIFFGYGVKCQEWHSNSQSMLMTLPIVEIQTKLQAVLQPKGLWDIDTFALHSVLYYA